MTDGVVQLEAPQRLLVIIVARIGDTLLATPAIRALAKRYPTARITVLAHPQRIALLRHLPFIHELAPITKHRAIWQGHFARWLGRSFDAALVFGHDQPLLAYARRVARYVVTEADEAVTSGRTGWLLVPSTAGAEHAVIHRLRWAAAVDAPADGRQLAYGVTAEERTEAGQMLAGLLGPRQAPVRWLGLQLQSFPTKAYRDWPVGHFHSLLEKLLPAQPDLRVVVLGDRASAQAAQILVAAFPERVFSLAGRLALRQTAAVMSQLSVYLGVDTGPTHLVGALGVPMVALYHCKHPGRYLAPLDHPALTVIEHPASMAECGEDRTMAEISVAQVYQALSPYLGLAANGGVAA